MAAKFEIVDTDLGFDSVLDQMLEADRSYTKVGLIGEKAKERDQRTGLPLATIGLIHEYGTEDNRPPERSFIRNPVDEHAEEIADDLTKVAEQIFTPNAEAIAEAYIEAAGERLAEVIRDGIAVLQPPLKPGTLEQKPGARPLESLAAAITHVEKLRHKTPLDEE